MHRKLKLAIPVNRAATILGVSNNDIRKMIRDGELETVETFGGSRWVTVDSLNRVIIRGQWKPRAHKKVSRKKVSKPTPPANPVVVPDDKKETKEEMFEPPAVPVGGNSSVLLRSVPGTDAVPRGCPIDGGLMDRRGSHFVCISCGNQINVYDQQSIK